MRPVTFTVTGMLPLAINRSLRMHWAARKRHAKAFGMMLWVALGNENIRLLVGWRAMGLKIRVAMHVATPRLYDPDNLSSLAKQPIDFMVTAGWLLGDDPTRLEFDKPTQEVGKKAITFTFTPILADDDGTVRSNHAASAVAEDSGRT